MTNKLKIIRSVIVGTLIALVAGISALLAAAYFSTQPRVYTSDDPNGEIFRAGMRIDLLFDRLVEDNSEGVPANTVITYPNGVTGSFDSDAEWGSKDNPYIISMSRHMINLYVLQRNGYFEDHYISENFVNGEYAPDDPLDPKMPYFLVCETDGTPVTINGVVGDRQIELKPVGSEEHPFIGCVGGAIVSGTTTAPNGMTSSSSVIANFPVITDRDDPDIGLFGKIGYLGSENNFTQVNGVDVFTGMISGISDLLLYDVRIESKEQTFLERVADHIWSGKADSYQEDHHVGILAGHIEYAAITNISVYYTTDENDAPTYPAIDIEEDGANYLSDCGIIGLVYNLNPEISGNTIGCASGTTIAGRVEGAGEEWGGSIDMLTLHSRLQTVLSSAKSLNPRQSYVSAETVVIDEVTGETETTPTQTTRYTSATDSQETLQVYGYSSEWGGSFVFSDDTNDSTRYNLLLGKSATFFPKQVTTYTYKNQFEQGITIRNGSSDYLNALYANNAASVSNGTDADAATVWVMDASGHLSARVETANSIETYYLNASAGQLTLGTTASTVWTVNADDTITDDRGWILFFDGSAWSMVPSLNYVVIHDGTDYLVESGGNLTNGAESAASKWFADGSKLFTVDGANVYYLRATTSALSVSTNDSQSGYVYAFSYNGTDKELTFSSNGTYYVVYAGGWTVLNTTTRSYYISVTSGNDTYYLNGAANGVSTVTNQANATEWQYDASTGRFYTTIGTTPYYLRAALGQNNVRAATNLTTTTTVGQATSFTYSNSSLSCTLANTTYRLSLDNGALKMVNTSVDYYTLTYNTTNYLYLNGTTIANGTTEAQQTLWQFDVRNSNSTYEQVRISTLYNGTTSYYLTPSSSSLRNTTATNVYFYNSGTDTGTIRAGTNSYGYYIQYNSGWTRSNQWRSNAPRYAASITRNLVRFTAATVDLTAAAVCETEETGGTLSPSHDEVTHTLGSKSRQVVTKAVTTEAGGNDTYFPLVADRTAPYAVGEKNTGYIVSGSYASYQQASGDVRVSRYPMNSLSASFYNSGSLSSYTEANAAYMEVLTQTYLSNGLSLVSDTYNSTHTSGFSTNINTYRNTKTSPSALGLKKYDAARSQLHDTFLSAPSYIYGMHFMDAVISMDHLITAPKVKINGQEYENYELPEDSIDFRLKTKGYINFFAGTYYTNNASFFSLYQIFRTGNTITDIKRIEKIYGDPTSETKGYLYKFENEAAPTLPTGYVEVFDTAWIEHPTMVNNAMYYYEIPVNAGEYALGSVSGSYGAYLFYLDIGTSAASHTSTIGSIDFVYDNLSNKIVTVTDTSDNDSSLNYYKPSLSILYTKNTDRDANDDYVAINTFTVEISRTIDSVNDEKATINANFSGTDKDHLTVINQASNLGDQLNVTYIDPS